MKIGRKTKVASCVTLICAIAIVWHFVHSALTARQLAKDAAVLRACAEHGDAQCQFKLGSMYSRGKGLPIDDVEALRWYRKSAEQGNAKAQDSLAYMYYEGRGVPQDYVEAERWCEKAAEQGDTKAQDRLGFMYLHGKGVPQDYKEAARWYRKSADQADADAQYALGYLYYNGFGVPQDRAEGHRLFRAAAIRGNKLAQTAIGANKMHLSARAKADIGLKTLCGLLFLTWVVATPRKSPKLTNKIAALVAALCMLAAALDLYWYSDAGQLQSAGIITALYFARHLLSGVVVAFVSSVAFPRSGKVVLIASVALFAAFMVIRIVHCELAHLPVTIRLLCFAGFPIGMAITSAVFFGLIVKKNQTA